MKFSDLPPALKRQVKAMDEAGKSRPVRRSSNPRRTQPRGEWEYVCQGCRIAFASMAAWERHVDSSDCRRMELRTPDPKET